MKKNYQKNLDLIEAGFIVFLLLVLLSVVIPVSVIETIYKPNIINSGPYSVVVWLDNKSVVFTDPEVLENKEWVIVCKDYRNIYNTSLSLITHPKQVKRQHSNVQVKLPSSN